ncbi:MAG: hypothetical protein U0792_00760 [Gemmataceae bacterium]
MRDLTREATFTPSGESVEVHNGVVLTRKDGKAEISQSGRAGGEGTRRRPGRRSPTRSASARKRWQFSPGMVVTLALATGPRGGAGGFHLSLFGYDPTIDTESPVRGGLNRRVDAFNPADSLLLKKPLMRVAHVGGKKLNKSDLGYRVLLDWIGEGAKTDDEKQPACVKLTVFPGPNHVLRSPALSQQLSVIAHFADGTIRDVTTLATFEVSHHEILSVSDSALVTGLKRGQGAVSVRYLSHLESVHFTVIEDVPASSGQGRPNRTSWTRTFTRN